MANHNPPYNFKSLLGKQFGKWIVLGDAGRQSGKSAWMCRCECGTERVIRGQSLTRGVSVSCGCSRGATYTLAGHTKGDVARTPAYSSWISMRSRCNNENATHYARYGGRGIAVCDRWNKSFEAFLADMGDPPKGKETVERLDNNKNYEPGNCVWASRKEQAQNRTHNIKWQHRARDAAGRFS